MANGDKITTPLANKYNEREFDNRRKSGDKSLWKLWQALDAQGGADNGVWIDVRGWSQFTLHFSDLGTGTAKIFAAMGNAPPAINNTTNYDAGGGDITVASNADEIKHLNVPYDWLRVAKTAAGDTQSTNCVLKASH